VFHALADPTRRAILACLAEAEATFGVLSEPFPISLAAVSKHLAMLERAGLVTRAARGRERVCRMNPAALGDARAWLEFHGRFWSECLDALDELVRTTFGESGGTQWPIWIPRHHSTPGPIGEWPTCQSIGPTNARFS